MNLHFLTLLVVAGIYAIYAEVHFGESKIAIQQSLLFPNGKSTITKIVAPFQSATRLTIVDGRNPAPPGMYKTL